MKANLFAVLLSLLVVSLPLHAVPPLTEQQTAAKINLNKADAKALSRSVKGIGVKRAESIVKYRETHGNFKSFEELSQVKGLGAHFVKTHLAELQKVFTLK